jgi:hypothetical protein
LGFFDEKICLDDLPKQVAIPEAQLCLAKGTTNWSGLLSVQTDSGDDMILISSLPHPSFSSPGGMLGKSLKMVRQAWFLSFILVETNVDTSKDIPKLI